MSIFTVHSVNSAHYDKDGDVYYMVDATLKGERFSSMRHDVPSPHEDADEVCTTWLASNSITAYSKTEWDRRQEREEMFAATIDRMNPVWYDGLTDSQKTDLATWRQQWLDYPSTGTEPTASLVDGIF